MKIKIKNKILTGFLALAIPLMVSAQTVSLPVPMHISPVDGAAMTATNFSSVQWTPVTSGATALSYYAESSYTLATTTDGKFSSPFSVSSLLASASMVTTGSPDGFLYWHVRSADGIGNTSAWSAPWKVIIDSTAPSAPGIPSVVAARPPVAATTSVPTTTGITAATVATHATASDCWIIVSGKVYSVGGYAAMHPGGKSVITNLCGQDATTGFNTRGGTGSHSQSAKTTLGTLYVGDLASTVVSTPTVTASSTGVQVWDFASSTDLMSGVASYEYSTDGGATWTNNGSSTSFRTSFGLGTFSVSVRATDKAGNKSLITSGSFVVTATTTLPLPSTTPNPTVPPVVPPTPTTYPTKEQQCKKGAWKKFTTPKFKSERKCVDYAKNMAEKIKKQNKKAEQEREKAAKKARQESEFRKNSSHENENEREKERGGRGERD